MTTGSGRVVVPPIMMIQVEDTMDVMIARNTARRASSLLGFSSVSRAQVATAVAALADIILNVEARQTIHLHGLRDGLGEHFGILAAWRLANWLQGRSFRRHSRTPPIVRHERRTRLLAGRPLPQLARRIVFRIVRTEISFVLCITHTEHSPP